MFIVHRSSFIVHRSSFIVHRSSFIVHRSSSIVHRLSDSLALMKHAAAALLLVASPLFAASHIVDDATFNSIAAELSGERAQELDRRIVEYHRIQGSPMMASVAQDVVLKALQSAGVEARIEQFPSDGRTKYQSYLSPMGWSMRDGELWVEGTPPQRLCRYADVPMCVSTYSKGGQWSGELVDVGAGTSNADYAGKDVRGKVALASGYARDVVREAVLERGAVGSVIYPAANDRPDHPDMVRYNGVWTRAEDLDRTSGSFQISANQYAMLRAMMAKAPVRVRGRIDATLGPGQLTLVHAFIRGSESPDEVIVTAHLDHPKWSANDNASGSAALIEMARTLNALIAAKKLAPPRRTIHFMWVPEYFGTIAYLTKHPEVRACTSSADPRPVAKSGGCVIANINLDMVGEDTVKTNGRFYMTRAPLSVRSFLDALLPDLLAQTREARLFAPTGTRNYWPAEVTGYAPGSDHDLFLAIGVPASMFGHDPDWTHHTSEDTPDKTDASEFRRVGVLATNAAYWITSADADQWQRLAPAVAAERLRSDAAILVSMKRIGNGRLAAEAQKRMNVDVSLTERGTLTPRGAFIYSEPEIARPRSVKSLTIAPVDGQALRDVGADDARWLEEQRQRYDDFDVILFETVNWMNGRRSSSEIADLLSMEFGDELTPAWVNRISSILASLKLVDLPPVR
jgi:hypothetical protein